MSRLCMLPFLLLPLLLPTASGASPVRLDYAGSIDQLVDPGGLVDPGFGIGATFSGTLMLDPALATQSPLLGVAYTFPSLTGSFDFAGVPLTFRPVPPTGPPSIIVAESSLIDAFALVPPGDYDFITIPLTAPLALTANAPAGSSGACSTVLLDSTETALPGGFVLPTSLAGFDTTIFTCELFAPDRSVLATVGGTLTTWTVTPEPALGSLLLAAALVGRRRRSTRCTGSACVGA